MPQIDGAVSNLVQGVSQQRVRDRAPGQCELQENLSSDLIRGLRTLPASTFVGNTLGTSIGPDRVQWFQHEIDGRLFSFAIFFDEIIAYDENGTEVTVNVSSDFNDEYIVPGPRPINSADLDPDFVTLDIDDEILICNRAIQPALLTTNADVPNVRPLDTTVEFLGGQFGRSYVLEAKVGSNTLFIGKYQTPNGANSAHTSYVSAEVISRVFFKLMRTGQNNTIVRPFDDDSVGAANGGAFGKAYVDDAIDRDASGQLEDFAEGSIQFNGFFDVHWAQDTLLITPNPDEPEAVFKYSVTANDGTGNNTVVVTGQEITETSQLTRFGVNGQVTKVSAANGADTSSDFYLKFIPVGANALGSHQFIRGNTTGSQLGDRSTGAPGEPPDVAGTLGFPDNDIFSTIPGFNAEVTTAKPRADFEFYSLPGRPEWLVMHDVVGDGGTDVIYVPGSPDGVVAINFSDQSLNIVVPLDDTFPPIPEALVTSLAEAPLDVVSSFGKPGVWVETTAPYQFHQFDLDTMPASLTYDATANEFLLSRGSWEARRAGDDESNPAPEFVGRGIRDMSVFQGRLVLVGEPEIATSRSNKTFDLWNQSGALVTADDPLRLKSTARSRSRFQRAIQHDRSLIVFAEPNSQFVIDGSSAITPDNASLVLTTELDADMQAEPVGLGQHVIFASSTGAFTRVHEFFTDEDSLSNDADDITKHVPEYLRGKPLQIVVSTNFNAFMVRTDTDLKEIYLYEFVRINREKVQSSWSTIKFPFEVAYMSFNQELVTMVCFDDADNQYFLCTMNFDKVAQEDVGYEIIGDMVAKVFNVLGRTVPIPFPFHTSNTEITEDDIRVIAGDGSDNPGTLLPIDTVTKAGVSLPDPPFFTMAELELAEFQNTVDVYVCIKRTARYRPTLPLIKDSQGVAIGTGRHIVSRFQLNFEQSGHLKATVTSDYRDPATVEMEATELGRGSLGSPALIDGHLDIPFREKPDLADLEIVSDDVRPANLVDLEWVGHFSTTKRRV